MTQLLRLSILDSYGVRWSRSTFVRDLVQNFYDSTPDFRDVSLDIRADTRTVVLRGPVTFDIEYLTFVGASTKKDGKSAGGFGEGFKICALVGTRDFGLTMRAASGTWALEVTYDTVPLGRELCYRVTTHDIPLDGSHVTLTGCDDELLGEFQRARQLFRHPDNPLLQRCITGDPLAPTAVFLAEPPGTGHLFYRRQHRGEIRYRDGTRAEPGLTFVHDPVVDALEGDRDRRALHVPTLVLAAANALTPEQLHACVLAIPGTWRYGSDILTELLRSMIQRDLTFTWPEGWLARSRDDGGLAGLAERRGLKLARADFGAVGMRKVTDYFSGNLQTRAPTALESARLQVVTDLHNELLPRAAVRPYKVFSLRGAAIRGQHQGDTILVAQEPIEEGFDEVAPTVLHELAHEKGGEESNGFLEALTHVLDAVLRHPDRVDAARRRYAEVTEADAPAVLGKAPEPPSPPPRPTEYMPASARKELHDYEAGVFCVLLVPRGFPPAQQLTDALVAAAQAAGVTVHLIHHVVDSDKGAERFLAPGLPLLRVGLEGMNSASPPFAYRLLPENLAVDVEQLRARLLQAHAEGLVGDKGLRRVMDARDARKAALGMVPEKTPETEQAERTIRVQNRCFSRWGRGSPGLRGLWGAGLNAAAVHLARLHAAAPGTEDEAFAAVERTMNAAIETARALRRADAAFDDADPFDLAAMAAAQGVTACVAVTGKQDARDVFLRVRALTERVLQVPLHWALREDVLERAIAAGGMRWYECRPPLDVDAMEAAMDSLLPAAQRAQDAAELAGADVHSFGLNRLRQLVEPAHVPYVAPPPTAQELERIERSHRARDAFNQALAAGASVEEAARLCMEAGRAPPEPDAAAQDEDGDEP